MTSASLQDGQRQRHQSDESIHEYDDDEEEEYYYDDYACEAHYDDRDMADDDMEKGKLQFDDSVLYGRDTELKLLQDIYQRCCHCPYVCSGDCSGDPNASAASLLQSSSSSLLTTPPTSSLSASPQVVYIRGYSGVGKSTLVHAFVKKQQEIHLQEQEQKQGRVQQEIPPPVSSPTSRGISAGSCCSTFDQPDRSLFWFASGKYNEQMVGDPFSAIANAMDGWIRQQVLQVRKEREQQQQQQRKKRKKKKTPKRNGSTSTAASADTTRTNITTALLGQVRVSLEAAGFTYHHSNDDEDHHQQHDSGLDDNDNVSGYDAVVGTNLETSILLRMIPNAKKLLCFDAGDETNNNGSSSHLQFHNLQQRRRRQRRPSSSSARKLDHQALAALENKKDQDDDKNNENDAIGMGTGAGISKPSSSSTLTVSLRNSEKLNINVAKKSSKLDRNDLKQFSHVMFLFLQSLTKVCPLVLFLDDLQWADAASLDLIESLVVHGRGNTGKRYRLTATTSGNTAADDNIGVESFRDTSAEIDPSTTATTKTDVTVSGNVPNSQRGGEGLSRFLLIASHHEPTKKETNNSKSPVADATVASSAPSGFGSDVSQRLWEHLQELHDKKNYFTSISLSNLQPRYITQWIASMLGMKERLDEVAPLAQIIYNKTLGNPFYVRQALEELVRRNIIYYDVMTFEWTFNLPGNGGRHGTGGGAIGRGSSHSTSTVHAANSTGMVMLNETTRRMLQDVLSKDVVQMIQSKLKSMPAPLQRILLVMSHVHHSVDVSTLSACMKADTIGGGIDLSTSEINRYLEHAVQEGLLYNTQQRSTNNIAVGRLERAAIATDVNNEYKFCHDKIQEASITSIPEGHELNTIKVGIAHVLTGIATYSSIGMIRTSIHTQSLGSILGGAGATGGGGGIGGGRRRRAGSSSIHHIPKTTTSTTPPTYRSRESGGGYEFHASVSSFGDFSFALDEEESVNDIGNDGAGVGATSTDDDDDDDDDDNDGDVSMTASSRSTNSAFVDEFADNHDWMFFVAVQLFNSVPVAMRPHPMRLARLNVQVADLCLAKASFDHAVKLLRLAVQMLQNDDTSKDDSNGAEKNNDSTSSKESIRLERGPEETAPKNNGMSVVVSNPNLQGSKRDSSGGTTTATSAMTSATVAVVNQATAESDRTTKPDAALYWKTDYKFMLNLYNRWMETEFAAGNYDETKLAIEQLLEHATSLRDKCNAYYTKVAMTVQINNRNHTLGVIESTKFLSTHCGQSIPLNPTKADIFQERVRLKLALGPKSVSILTELPLMKDDWMMKLFGQLALLSNHSRNHLLVTLVTLRSIRISLEQGVSKYLPQILTNYLIPLRQNECYNTAYSYADIVFKIYERFPEEHFSGEYATGRMLLHSGILHLKQPFSYSIDVVVENYRLALVVGFIEVAFVSAIHFPLIYFATGLPLTALVGPKLIMFEDRAKRLGQHSFVIFFQVCRQFLYNLQDKSPPLNSNRAELRGEAMDEEEVLHTMEGHARKMRIRDMSIFRMALAFIFLDEDTMEEMMDRLALHPLFDLPLVREHMRVCYNGMAAMYMWRRSRKKEYLNLGHTMLRKVRKLDRVGSPNAGPVRLCIRALERHTKKCYDDAIKSCLDANILHLEAMMHEHCGLLLFDQSNHAPKPSKVGNSSTAAATKAAAAAAAAAAKSKEIEAKAKQYMGKAMWLYHDWGAMAKVKQLKSKYKFLISYPRAGDGGTTPATTPATTQSLIGVVRIAGRILQQGERGQHQQHQQNIPPMQHRWMMNNTTVSFLTKR